MISLYFQYGQYNDSGVHQASLGVILPHTSSGEDRDTVSCVSDSEPGAGPSSTCKFTLGQGVGLLSDETRT